MMTPEAEGDRSTSRPILARARSAPDLTTEDTGVTLMVVCAGGPMVKILPRLQAELDGGRRVNVVATPHAASWIDHYGIGSVVEELCGWPVRSELPAPTTPVFEPAASAVLVSPCTLNTLTKWAAAHADNLAISLLCEALGRGVPTVAEVSLSGPYAELTATREALTRLADAGVVLRRAHGATEPASLPPVAAEVAERIDRAGTEA